MQAKAFNPQIFLEFLCYSIFGGLICYLIFSKKYLLYVTPRMEPYLYFTAVIMGIWAAAGIVRLFRPRYKVRLSHCYVLVIPILLLLIPHSPLNASDLAGNFTAANASGNMPKETLSESTAGSPEDFSVNEGEQWEDNSLAGSEEDTVSDSYFSGLTGLDEVNKKITVSDEEFGLWLTEFSINMEKYEGYTVVMTGYVFKDPEFMNNDEFAAARLMMSCCVADLAPAGLIFKYDKADQLEPDSWVSVEGTLSIGQYEYEGQMYDEPQVLVTNITPAEEVEGYVYSY